MSHTFSLEELQALCREWQERLRLEDWRIKVALCRSREFRERGRVGECESHFDRKVAVIRILDPVDYPPDILTPQDHEVDLVHELLHLHAAPLQFEEGTLQDLALEHLIEFTAQALVRFKRESKVNSDGDQD